MLSIVQNFWVGLWFGLGKAFLNLIFFDVKSDMVFQKISYNYDGYYESDNCSFKAFSKC